MAKILNNGTSLQNSGGQIMTATDMEIYSDIVNGDHFLDNDPFAGGDPTLDNPWTGHGGGSGGSSGGDGGNGNSGGTVNYDPDPDGIDKWDEENRNNNQEQPTENKLIKYVAYAAIALGILKLIKR